MFIRVEIFYTREREVGLNIGRHEVEIGAGRMTDFLSPTDCDTDRDNEDENLCVHKVDSLEDGQNRRVEAKKEVIFQVWYKESLFGVVNLYGQEGYDPSGFLVVSYLSIIY